MKRKNWSFATKICGLICLVALQGCFGGTGNDDDDDDEVRPIFLTNQSCPLLRENEPNDTTGQTQGIGALQPGACFVIDGTVANESDIDGYSISMLGPQSLTIYLSHGSDKDFDITLFSRDLVGDVVSVCQATTNPEQCGVQFNGTEDTLEVFVIPFSGDGGYTLEIVSQQNDSSRTSTTGYIPTN